MHTRSPLVSALVAAAALTGLAGCDTGSEEASAGGLTAQSQSQDAKEPSSKERIAMAGTAWLSVSREGYVYQTFLDADGRYRDLRDGALVLTGEWRQTARGELCFSPDEGARACWSYGGVEPDGTLRITDEDGRAVILRRITYTPPVEPEAGGTEADGAEADGAEGGD